MGDTGVMSGRIVDALVATGVVAPDQRATIDEVAASAGMSAGRLLLERGVIVADDVATVLESELGVPRVDLSSYTPDEAALSLVSAETARGRRLLPLFEIDNMLTVAIGDPADAFELDTLSAELGVDVEPVLAEPESVSEALSQHYGPSADDDAPIEAPAPSASGKEAEAVASGDVAEPVTDAGAGEEPVQVEMVADDAGAAGVADIDLDVLAVADATKVALLVSDILEHAVRSGATGVQLLPYKDEFFLVYRIGERLESVASAPLSLQSSLVDGIKAYARLGSTPATSPALGRVRSRIADRDIVLTVSVVPTLSGQRLVISLTPESGVPRTLTELGMAEAESRALHAMVERGRGILLVCGPVAGGRSCTYYALLARAAAAGKTVYSVERSVAYEMPAVAQVLVAPGSPVGAASYFAAGMRQDTDVIAIDALHSVEEVDLAVEAAGLGKLVIATFSGGGIVAGARRMLDLGVEPASLAAALTFGVGQRLVRTNCPQCLQEEAGGMGARIPGAPAGTSSRTGVGCEACASSGFAGVTGIFEVLPFAESVRSAIAANAGTEEIDRRAREAGMRPMAAAGLAKVEQGIVSAAELNRVLRFAE